MIRVGSYTIFNKAALAESEQLKCSSELCWDFGFKSAQAFHVDLKKRGILQNQSGEWMVTKAYAGKGFTYRVGYSFKGTYSARMRMQLKWTSAGVNFLKSIYRADV